MRVKQNERAAALSICIASFRLHLQSPLSDVEEVYRVIERETCSIDQLSLAARATSGTALISYAVFPEVQTDAYLAWRKTFRARFANYQLCACFRGRARMHRSFTSPSGTCSADESCRWHDATIFVRNLLRAKERHFRSPCRVFCCRLLPYLR